VAHFTTKNGQSASFCCIVFNIINLKKGKKKNQKSKHKTTPKWTQWGALRQKKSQNLRPKPIIISKSCKEMGEKLEKHQA
jgi:hypothetical protein